MARARARACRAEPEDEARGGEEPSHITEAKRLTAKARERACSNIDEGSSSNQGRSKVKSDSKVILISDDET